MTLASVTFLLLLLIAGTLWLRNKKIKKGERNWFKTFVAKVGIMIVVLFILPLVFISIAILLGSWLLLIPLLVCSPAMYWYFRLKKKRKA